MQQTNGDAGETYQYTRTQFELLSQEERSAIDRVAEYLTGEKLDDASNDEVLSSTFNILRPYGVCVPEDEVGDDLLLSVRRKFACIYYSAEQLAEDVLKRKGFQDLHDFAFCHLIDSSYEDATHVAVIDYREDERPFCYFHVYYKAWHFCFETLKKIAEEVLKVRDEIVSTFLRVSAKKPKKGGTE